MIAETTVPSLAMSSPRLDVEPLRGRLLDEFVLAPGNLFVFDGQQSGAGIVLRSTSLDIIMAPGISSSRHTESAYCLSFCLSSASNPSLAINSKIRSIVTCCGLYVTC